MLGQASTPAVLDALVKKLAQEGWCASRGIWCCMAETRQPPTETLNNLADIPLLMQL